MFVRTGYFANAAGQPGEQWTMFFKDPSGELPSLPCVRAESGLHRDLLWALA